MSVPASSVPASVGIGPKYPHINAYLQKLAAQAAKEEAEKKAGESKTEVPPPTAGLGETKETPAIPGLQPYVPSSASVGAGSAYSASTPGLGLTSGSPSAYSASTSGLGLTGSVGSVPHPGGPLPTLQSAGAGAGFGAGTYASPLAPYAGSALGSMSQAPVPYVSPLAPYSGSAPGFPGSYGKF
jgi:hypothetical protein